MKYLPGRKTSMLGIVLVVTSAVVAAVIPPYRNDPTKEVANGTSDLTSDGGVITATCNPAVINQTCFDSFTSGPNSTTTGINASTGDDGLNTEECREGD